MSYRGPRVKKSRALGVALTPKASSVMARKPYPPGAHGRRRRKKSEYAEQLLEKQRLRFQYNLKEKQLRRYYDEANRQKGNTGDNLLRLLESRLDNLVCRAGFAPTIYAARQLVSHGHIRVNGKKLNIPSYKLAPGVKITIAAKAQKIPSLVDSLERTKAPGYVAVAKDKFEAEFVRAPEVPEIPVICQTQLVVEFYSR